MLGRLVTSVYRTGLLIRWTGHTNGRNRSGICNKGISREDRARQKNRGSRSLAIGLHLGRQRGRRRIWKVRSKQIVCCYREKQEKSDDRNDQRWYMRSVDLSRAAELKHRAFGPRLSGFGGRIDDRVDLKRSRRDLLNDRQRLNEFDLSGRIWGNGCALHDGRQAEGFRDGRHSLRYRFDACRFARRGYRNVSLGGFGNERRRNPLSGLRWRAKGRLSNVGSDCRSKNTGMRNPLRYRVTLRLKTKLRPYLVEDIVELRANDGVLRCRSQKGRSLKADIGLDDGRRVVRTDVENGDVAGISRTRGWPEAAQGDLVAVANDLVRYLWQGRFERAKNYLGVRGLNCLCRQKSHRSLLYTV